MVQYVVRRLQVETILAIAHALVPEKPVARVDQCRVADRAVGVEASKLQAAQIVLGMDVEQCHSRLDWNAVDLGPLPGLADEERGAEQQSPNPRVVDTTGEGHILGAALGAPLPALTDALLGPEARAVEAGHDIGAVGQRSSVAKHTDADVAPGRRDDQPLGLCASRAVEDRRLVQFIQEAHGHEHEAGPYPGSSGWLEVEVRELHRDLALLLGSLSRRRMFELELGVEEDAV